MGVIMNYYNLSNFDYFFARLALCFTCSLSAIFIFLKTQNIKTTKKRIIIVFIFNIIISLIHSLTDLQNTALVHSITYIGTALSFSVLKKENKTKSILIALIAIGVTSVIKYLSVFILSIGMWLVQAPINTPIPYYVECGMIIILTILFLKIKRIRKGIQFFESEDNLGLGLVISGLIYILNLAEFPSSRSQISTVSIICVFGIIVAGFGLYIWIRKGITKHYREKLQLKSELYYKEQLEQKEQEIEKLNHSNEYLAKIVHRDNHLMSSLNSSINAYFESNDKEFKDDILRKIQTLSNERAELINNEQRDSKILPSTGNTLIDGAINDLYIKAVAHGIDFDLSVSATVDDIIGKYISQTDLQTLICDHIKDAIIAVDAKNENNGKILAELSMENDNYTISIFDSGVDFEIDTLAKLGKERVTTHADNGGSGIGFMTTFETIRKSYASLIITEFANKTPFSKSISIRFDGNTAFIIQPYRKEELKSVLTRDDVILL